MEEALVLKRILETAAILAAAALTTLLSRSFSLPEMLGWAVFYMALFWIPSQKTCSLPRWLGGGPPKPQAPQVRT